MFDPAAVRALLERIDRLPIKGYGELVIAARRVRDSEKP